MVQPTRSLLPDWSLYSERSWLQGESFVSLMLLLEFWRSKPWPWQPEHGRRGHLSPVMPTEKIKKSKSRRFIACGHSGNRGGDTNDTPVHFGDVIMSSLGLNRGLEIPLTKQCWSRCGSAHHWSILLSACLSCRVTGKLLKRETSLVT